MKKIVPGFLGVALFVIFALGCPYHPKQTARPGMSVEGVSDLSALSLDGRLMLAEDEMHRVDEMHPSAKGGADKFSSHYKIYETYDQHQDRVNGNQLNISDTPRQMGLLVGDIIGAVLGAQSKPRGRIVSYNEDGTEKRSEPLDKTFFYFKDGKLIDEKVAIAGWDNAQREETEAALSVITNEMLARYNCPVVYLNGFLCARSSEYERLTDRTLKPAERIDILRAAPLRCSGLGRVSCSGCTIQRNTPADIVYVDPGNNTYRVRFPVKFEPGYTLAVTLVTDSRTLSCPNR